MKTTSAILINSALLAVALAMIPLLSVAQSPYSDTYINKASLQKEAEEVKKQRELEAQRQLEYEKWYKEQQEAQKVTNNQPQKETIKKPEDFASYAEYREYLDGLGQRTKQNVNNTTTSQGNQQQQGGTVVNNYYVNTPPQQSQQVVTTSVVYDPFWDSPSVTMGLFFDPWYMTSYRVRYYRSSYYWRDPFWDYPWAYSYYGWNYYDPWGWSNSYNRGFRDGYMAGSYDYGYYPYLPPYYGGYYTPPSISIPREPTVYGVRRASTSSMSGYGQVQRSASAQTLRAQSNTDGYYRNTVQTTRNADYTPTYTSPESGSSRHYNNSSANWSQPYTRSSQPAGQTTRQTDYQYQSQPSRNYNYSAPSTRSYTPQQTTRQSSSYNSSAPQTTRSSYSGSSNSGNSGGNNVQQTTRR